MLSYSDIIAGKRN